VRRVPGSAPVDCSDAEIDLCPGLARTMVGTVAGTYIAQVIFSVSEMATVRRRSRNATEARIAPGAENFAGKASNTALGRLDHRP
jgi:hypothetical protein